MEVSTKELTEEVKYTDWFEFDIRGEVKDVLIRRKGSRRKSEAVSYCG